MEIPTDNGCRQESRRQTWHELIRLITFVDLPIKKKFRLFAVGTIFWFLSMAAVAVVSLTAIHYKYNQIAGHTLPYSQAISKVIVHVQGISSSITQAQQETGDAGARQLESAQNHVKSIRGIISALSLGINSSQGSTGGNLVENFILSMARSDVEGTQYLQRMLTLVEQMDRHISLLQQFRQNPAENAPDIQHILNLLGGQLEEAHTLSANFTESLTGEYTANTQLINEIVRTSIHIILLVLLLATLLLLIFTRWITGAFYKPIDAIINQIHDLGTGKVDLDNKLTIHSKDEMGTLSSEFNELIETVYGMTIFKKVIEEDSTLDEVYRRLGEVFENELGIERYMIYEVNGNKKEMRAGYPPLVGDRKLFCYEDILSDCSLCRAVKTGHTVSSFEFRGVCRQFLPDTGMEHVCIPMMLAGVTGGVVQFLFPSRGEKGHINEVENQQLFKAETYIKQSLSVVETKRLMNTLRESAMVDTLTGLYNRRFLQEHTKQIISGVLRRRKTIGLLLCDIDYFKQINDTFGHDVGDLVLKEAAACMRNSVREADIVIRFGGEEFLILLLDVDQGDAIDVAEKIRVKIGDMKITVPDAVIQKTISIGVSEFPGDTDGFWQAIKFADVALYKAKETGRNKTVRFEPDMWPRKEF